MSKINNIKNKKGETALWKTVKEGIKKTRLFLVRKSSVNFQDFPKFHSLYNQRLHYW